MRRWRRPGVSGVSGGPLVLGGWGSCLVCKQKDKAVPIVGMCAHFRFAGDGSATAIGIGDGSATATGMLGCSSGGLGVTCGCLSSVEDGV